jgi:hypothetical protein
MRAFGELSERIVQSSEGLRRNGHECCSNFFGEAAQHTAVLPAAGIAVTYRCRMPQR